jgi:sulfite reductase (NADPH) flavoprotein alpha-component
MNHPVNLIPVLPENAPFTTEQRAYLNGFLAGLCSHAPVPAVPASPVPEKRLEPLAILVGSQTGNAETLARRVAKEAAKHSFAPAIHDLARYEPRQLAAERNLLVLTSTFGDGEPPDNAKAFWNFLAGADAPRLDGTRFSVCALGDSNYPKFCQFGREVDLRLEKLGAARIHPRQDCDVDLDQAFAGWLAGAVGALSNGNGCGAVMPVHGEPKKTDLSATPVTPEFSKKNPFPARLLKNRRLNGEGSEKDVRHFEIEIEGSGLTYEVGDALGVSPTNDPVLVDEILTRLGFDGEEAVLGNNGEMTAMRPALRGHYEITRIPKPLIEAMAERTGDATLKKLLSPAANGDLSGFLRGREIIDLLLAHPDVRFTPAEFVALLRKLQPRLYSISSSPRAHPGEVHLTVGTVRYESFGRQRRGVCSTFLADRVDADTPVPVFVHSNNAFRPPAADMPLIMIGPGTGIAPFRAYLEEREMTGAVGKNWLFFGDQHAASDHLYRDEIERFQKNGVLTRLDLAWSRDQSEKIYVQHQMIEHARELWEWLEEGASFHVCGDASRMAKDVDAALHTVIEIAGGRRAEEAADYVNRLKAEKRYRRDVY